MKKRRIIRYYYGWNIIAVTVVMQVFVMGIAQYGTGVAMLAWGKEFGTPRVVLTAVPVGMPLAIAAMSPFGGQLLDRRPIRLVLAFGLCAFTGALLLISAARSFWQVVALYLTLVAMSHVLIGSMTAQTLAGKWFSRRRGLALSIAAAGGGLGGLIVPPVFQGLIDATDWRSAYRVLAIVGLIVMAPLVAAIRPPPESFPDGEGTTQPSLTSKFEDVPVRVILTDPVFLSISFGLAALISIHLAIQYNLPAIAVDAGINATGAAALISVLAGMSLISKPAWGPMLDRCSPQLVFVCMSGLYCAAVVITVLSPERWLYASLMTAAAMSGFASGGVQSALGVVLARQFGGANLGRALGLGFPVLTASAIGPFVAAASFSRTGSYNPGLVALAILAGLVTVVLVRTFRSRLLAPTVA